MVTIFASKSPTLSPNIHSLKLLCRPAHKAFLLESGPLLLTGYSHPPISRSSARATPAHFLDTRKSLPHAPCRRGNIPTRVSPRGMYRQLTAHFEDGKTSHYTKVDVLCLRQLTTNSVADTDFPFHAYLSEAPPHHSRSSVVRLRMSISL